MIQFNETLEGVTPQFCCGAVLVIARSNPPGRFEMRDSCSGFDLCMGFCFSIDALCLRVWQFGNKKEAVQQRNKWK